MSMSYTPEQLEIWVDIVEDFLRNDEECDGWVKPTIVLQDFEAANPYFLIRHGSQRVGVLIEFGKVAVVDRYDYQVGLAEKPADDDYIYTWLKVAEVQAESMSNGNDRVYAVWYIREEYPQIVALAWHATVFTRQGT